MDSDAELSYKISSLSAVGSRLFTLHFENDNYLQVKEEKDIWHLCIMFSVIKGKQKKIQRCC